MPMGLLELMSTIIVFPTLVESEKVDIQESVSKWVRFSGGPGWTLKSVAIEGTLAAIPSARTKLHAERKVSLNPEYLYETSINVEILTSHDRGVRGLALSHGSGLFGGAFGRAFQTIPDARFGTQATLKLLRKVMVGADDSPKDGPDAEESGTPAIHTYLVQFGDRDLTLDSASTLQRESDRGSLARLQDATIRQCLEIKSGRVPWEVRRLPRMLITLFNTRKVLYIRFTRSLTSISQLFHAT
jgi:hypothetical protein